MSSCATTCCNHFVHNYINAQNRAYEGVSKIPGFSHVQDWMSISHDSDDETHWKTVTLDVIKVVATVFTLFVGAALIVGIASCLKTLCDRVCNWCGADSEQAADSDIENLKSLPADITTLESQLEKDVHEVTAEVSALRSEIATKNARNVELSSDLTSANDQVNYLDRRVSELFTNLGIAESVTKSAEARATALEQAAKETAEKVQELAGQVSVLSQKNNELSVANTELEKANTTLETANTTLEYRIQAAEFARTCAAAAILSATAPEPVTGTDSTDPQSPFIEDHDDEPVTPPPIRMSLSDDTVESKHA